MEDWLEDRKATFMRKHKKQYTALMALAPRLVQLAQYDIPALEKQIKKNETALEECLRVQEEAEKTQSKVAERREATLREYNIEVMSTDAVSISAAIDKRISDACILLTVEFRRYAQEYLQTFSAQYTEFLKTTAGTLFHDGIFASHFPWLHRAVEEALLPLPDQHSSAQDSDAAAADASPQIDWGDVDVAPSSGDGGTAVEICWDAEEMEARVDDLIDTLPLTTGKVFSIDLALTKNRIALLTEMQGISCFCSDCSSLALTSFQAATKGLQELLSSSREVELARMKENYRAKDSFMDRISRFEYQITVAKNRKAAHGAKMQEVNDELSSMRPQYDELIQAAAAVRDDALLHLRELLPDREVLLVGDLNKYLCVA